MKLNTVSHWPSMSDEFRISLTGTKCLFLFVILILCPFFKVKAGVASFFDTDSEGWTAVGDTIAGVEYVPTQGREGGGLRVTDEAVGGVWFFVAGAKFLGDQSNAYGATLSFDLRQVISGAPRPFGSEDVIFEGGGLRLVYTLSSPPPTSGAWRSYTVPLKEDARWKAGSSSGAGVTQLQFMTVLGNLTSLRIRGEYQTGPDVGYLDNVIFSSNSGVTPESLEIDYLPVLSVEGNLGYYYKIDYSETLENPSWHELQTFRLISSPQRIVDYSASRKPRRFYRIVRSQ